jgi:predicted nucleic acid-binding protein
MAGFAPDTSCIVAAVSTWHQHHEAAFGEIDKRLRAREPLLLPAPALVEAYAVLTRLPPPYRVSAAHALTLLDQGFMAAGVVVVLDAAGYAGLLRRAPDRGIVGGRTYDAVIAACVLKGKGDALLTFNPDDFGMLADQGVDLVVPGSGR